MSNLKYRLLHDVHIDLLPPTPGETFLTTGSYEYYHYGCDNINDQGWGCGYRTLQTVCSWLKRTMKNDISVPSIPQIQSLLVEMEDKPAHFNRSREWIGTIEACLVIDRLYNVPCKIVHVIHSDLKNQRDEIINHFKRQGSPFMMGGDKDCSSKGIVGIHVDTDGFYLLVVDPHFTGMLKDSEPLISDRWIKWMHCTEFLDSSFYNLCLPQLNRK